MPGYSTSIAALTQILPKNLENIKPTTILHKPTWVLKHILQKEQNSCPPVTMCFKECS